MFQTRPKLGHILWIFQVSGAVYEKWKALKAGLEFPNDEKLVLHLLEIQENSVTEPKKEEEVTDMETKENKVIEKQEQQPVKTQTHDVQVQTCPMLLEDEDDDEEEEEKPIIRLTKGPLKQDYQRYHESSEDTNISDEILDELELESR